MSSNALENVRALVVDDVSFTLQRLTATLEQLGIPEVHASANGVTACELLADGNIAPNMIVADFQMPEMNGLELLKKVRTGEVPNLPHDVVFVILTGYLELSRSIPAVRLAVDGLLSKPLTPAVAGEKLSRLFGAETVRRVQDAAHYADMALDSGGALEAETVASPSGTEAELPILEIAPDAILARDLTYPNGDLLLPRNSRIDPALLGRLQEVADLSGGIHRLWVWTD